MGKPQSLVKILFTSCRALISLRDAAHGAVEPSLDVGPVLRMRFEIAAIVLKLGIAVVLTATSL